MANGSGADGKGDIDIAARLSRMGNRTNLMVIDATLNALPSPGDSHADAAAEIRALSRRLIQATRDFQATVEPVAAE